MSKKTRIQFLTEEGYVTIHPETTIDQVIDETTGLTLGHILEEASGVRNFNTTTKIVTATANNQTRFEFDDPFFNKDKNVVIVFVTGEFIHVNEEYTIDPDGDNPAIVFNNGGYPTGTKVAILIIRDAVSVENEGRVDGTVLRDATITKNKLSIDIQEKIDKATANRLPYMLGNVTGLSAQSTDDKISIKWKDPNDLKVTADDGTEVLMASWAGTKLVYKEGSYPTSVEDGTLVVDSKVRNTYETVGCVVSGLETGKTYYFMLFPYSDSNVVTVDILNRVEATVSGTKLGNVTGLQIGVGGSKAYLKWTDPADVTTEFNGSTVTLARWGGTKVVYKVGGYPANENDGTVALDSKVRNAYASTNLKLGNLPDGAVVYFALFPYTDNGVVTNDAANKISVTANYVELGNVSGMSVSSEGDTATIKWTDPNDITATVNGENVVAAKWSGTKLVRKAGSVPTDVEDGDLVVDSKVRDAYSNNGFNDSGLSDGVTYYYKAFPYSDDNKVTNDDVNSGSVKISLFSDDSGAPGPTTLLGGTSEAGFFGEVPTSEFITGDALASTIGLTAGTSQFSSEPWLKFSLDGKILFVAKKPFRHSISWDQINSANAVNGSKTITIGGNTYKVRLFRGAQNNPAIQTDADRDAIGSEWNRLMLPIHVQSKDQSWSYPDYAGTVQGWNINYTDQDLHTHNTYGNGTYSWCQEVSNQNSSYRAHRGGDGVSYSGLITSSNTTTYYGWRPVLELIPPGEDTSGAPGATKTIAGSSEAGFFGEVTSDQFITGDALALQVGISSGTSQFSNEPWLKFMLDGKILFVAKKPFRHSISWDQINAANAVNGSKTVVIGGNTYKVRLMRGAQNNPSANNDADRDAIGSEWNRLMLPIHVDAPNSWKINGTANNAYGGTSEDWNINYTDQDLHTYNSYGNGTYSWCQETTSSDSSSRVGRGNNGVSGSNWYTSSYTIGNSGWRPVLELIPPGEDKSGAPGATKTIAGSSEAGFFGEVTSDQFITGDSLASSIGLTAGTPQFSNEPWLKFMLDGKILFVAKKPFRYNISWDAINTANAVNGSKTVVINGNTYKVRLFRGAQNNPAIQTDADRDAIGSEWNRLMLPIHVDAPNSWMVNGSPNTQYAGTTEDWNINYTDQDLHTHRDYGSGTYSWCQEVSDQSASYRVGRGDGGVSGSGWYGSSNTGAHCGWRPVLELVQAP